MYAAVKNAPDKPMTMNNVYPLWPTLSMISSFEKKPEKGNTPHKARVEITHVPNVIGMNLRKPPMSFFMSNEWCDALWLMEPAPKNKHALKNAWVKMWKTAGNHAPAPRPIIM